MGPVPGGPTGKHDLPLLESLNPDLQLHRREPVVFVHICAQPPLFVLHSLISKVFLVQIEAKDQ